MMGFGRSRGFELTSRHKLPREARIEDAEEFSVLTKIVKTAKGFVQQFRDHTPHPGSSRTARRMQGIGMATNTRRPRGCVRLTEAEARLMALANKGRRPTHTKVNAQPHGPGHHDPAFLMRRTAVRPR